MPFLVISPYARQNYVDHTVTDQASVLRFIEDNFNLGRIDSASPKTVAAGGSFDQIAGSIKSMFDFDRDHGKFDHDDNGHHGDHDDDGLFEITVAGLLFAFAVHELFWNGIYWGLAEMLVFGWIVYLGIRRFKKGVNAPR